MTVLAANRWTSNADLIVDVARLGYINDTDRVLDPTYGRGIWWKKYRPTHLTTHNRSEDGSDFRNLPYLGSSFDVIAYDPPYVAKGGRETSGIREMDDRYGQYDCPATPALLQELINDGLTEMRRLVTGRGFVLVKCQNYVSSGRLWLGAHHTLTHALSLGFDVCEVFQHVGSVRAQPPGRRQVHARQNYSTLYVFQAKGTPWPTA